MVEGVDIKQFASISGGHFKEVKKLTDGVGIHFGKDDRLIHATRTIKRIFGALTLCFDELIEGLTTQEGNIRELFATVGDFVFIAECTHLEEGNHLVIRAFGVELQLAMLIGYA